MNDIRINLYQFDDKYQVDYENVPVKDVKPLEFRPRGWTALYDAMGKTINSMGERYAAMNEDERPEKVMLIVITDGAENSSTEFSFKDVQEKIEHQQSKYNWKIIFLGSELKTVDTAKSMGIAGMNTLNYKNNHDGLRSMYHSLSKGVTKLNAADVFDMSDEGYACMCAFDASDQEEQDKI